jgi:hypothetical protein
MWNAVIVSQVLQLATMICVTEGVDCIISESRFNGNHLVQARARACVCVISRHAELFVVIFRYYIR